MAPHIRLGRVHDIEVLFRTAAKLSLHAVWMWGTTAATMQVRRHREAALHGEDVMLVATPQVLSDDHTALLEARWPARTPWKDYPNAEEEIRVCTKDMTAVLARWRDWPRATVYVHDSSTPTCVVLYMEQLGKTMQAEVFMSNVDDDDAPAFKLPAYGVLPTAGYMVLPRRVALHMIDELAEDREEAWTIQCTPRGLEYWKEDEAMVVHRCAAKFSCLRRSASLPVVKTIVKYMVMFRRVLRRGRYVEVTITPEHLLTMRVTSQHMGCITLHQGTRDVRM